MRNLTTVLALAVSLPLTGHAGGFTCNLTYYTSEGPARGTGVVTLDPNTLVMTAGSGIGWVKGKVEKIETAYFGTLSNERGSRHVSLNRYTGEIMLSSLDTKQAEYTGTCEPAAPKF